VRVAMDQNRKDYAEMIKIRACEDSPAAHNPSLYERLRFGVLASAWVPRPIGMLLWSVLHVLLTVGGPVVMVVELAIIFIFYCILIFGTWDILMSFSYGLCGSVTLAIDSLLLLGRSTRFCWSWVCKHLRFLQTRDASHETIVVWRIDAW